MKDAPFHETSGEPRYENSLPDNKTLQDIGRLLNLPTRRDAKVSHEPRTTEKASLTLLTTIMLDSGLDDATRYMDALQEFLWSFLKAIEQAGDESQPLANAIANLDPSTNEHAFTVHRTTVMNMIPDADRVQLDEQLEDQYIDCMNELDAMGAKSEAIIIAGDETHERVNSKYKNGNFSYVVVGQTSTWQRGFVFPTEYDATHQLFMGSRHRDYRLIDSEKKGLRPWIRDVSGKCQKARELGIDQILIEGDRTYFNAELFALADLGKIDPGADIDHQPRVIVPRKFTRDKDEHKWDYLLDGTKPQVYTEFITLNPRVAPALRRECEGVFAKTQTGNFLVPYTCVAMIDEYNSKEKRTLDEIRARAKIVQAGIERETSNFETSVEGYKMVARTKNGKTPKEPSFGRGRLRTKFKRDDEKRAYQACVAAHAKLEKWKKEKARLLKTLMFFAISKLPGDDPDANPSAFIAFARDYHARWGIENGFRDVKDRFLSEGRSRRPCMRQFRLMLGMMLYNRWEVERKRIATAWETDHGMTREHAEASRPWIRRKVEKICHELPTAVGFLVGIWQAGLLSLAKSVIT